MSWTRLSEEQPKDKEICDFIFSPNVSEDVWMLCRCTIKDTSLYTSDDENVWWRPTEPLPSILLQRIKAI